MGLLSTLVEKGTKKSGLGGSGGSGGQSKPPVSAKSTGIAQQFVDRMFKKTGVNGNKVSSDSSASMTE